MKGGRDDETATRIVFTYRPGFHTGVDWWFLFTMGKVAVPFLLRA
ncbi:MAG: hypothetical protein O2954_00610 [bacterium]|nr:hypothetical protein [bacterium]